METIKLKDLKEIADTCHSAEELAERVNCNLDAATRMWRMVSTPNLFADLPAVKREDITPAVVAPTKVPTTDPQAEPREWAEERWREMMEAGSHALLVRQLETHQCHWTGEIANRLLERLGYERSLGL